MAKAELPKFWIEYSVNEFIAEPHKIFPWDMSATKLYKKEELEFLRDADVDWIASNIIGADTKVQTEGVLKEYIGHGYIHKGALVARRLVKLDPDAEGFIKDLFYYEPDVAEDLLYTRLDFLAEKPSELVGYGRLEFVL
jgi:hypothetical protein